MKFGLCKKNDYLCGKILISNFIKEKNKKVMEAIIVGSVFCAFCLGLYIFDHTKTGKKFFGSK
jgi:hypothetical protein